MAVEAVQVVDVAPRDGLQNEAHPLSTEHKLALIERLEQAGVRAYEAASFVHPARVPQMADAEAVWAGLPRTPARRYAVVVNARGFARALAAGAKDVRLVVAASQTMNERNANASTETILAQYRPLMGEARRRGVRTSGVVAVAFGCPFEGAVDPAQVLGIAASLVHDGAQEIDFADTVGMAVPRQVTSLVRAARRDWPALPLGIHLHNTRNAGLANAYAALEAGVDAIDAALGGAGGCPFAPRATGNIPTEDLVFMLEAMGVQTGIDLERLIAAAQWFQETLGRTLPGMVMRAGACWSTPPPLAP